VIDVHQFVGALAVVSTAALLIAEAASVITARRSRGAADHRFAVDRLALATIGIVALNGLIGLLLVAVGGRPADGLHLLYGPAALVTLPGAVWLSKRGERQPDRGRAQGVGWLVIGTVLLLGVELRLFMTG
jgi:heme A synthase